MTDSNSASSGDTGQKVCVFKGCNTRLGLKKSKAGQWYCVNHHPDRRKNGKAKKAAIARGKKSGKARRDAAKADTFTFDTKPNKASIMEGMIAQVNFLARDVRPRELRRHNMIKSLWESLREFVGDEGDDKQKEQRVIDIMESELPQSIKLSKLVDILGPKAALEKIKVVIKRGGHEAKMLDGVSLLQEKDEDGKPKISTPDQFTLSETENTADVPADLDLPESNMGEQPSATGAPAEAPIHVPENAGAGAPPPPAQAPAPAAAAPPAPAPAAPPPPPQPPQDPARMAYHQAKELLGIYKVKVIGGFTPHDQVLKIFHEALLSGVPLEDLRQRVMFPRSDTDQPAMMVKDARERAVKKAAAG